PPPPCSPWLPQPRCSSLDSRLPGGFRIRDHHLRRIHTAMDAHGTPLEIQRARIVAGDGAVREHPRTPFSWSGAVQSRTATVVELAIAYFPGWEVRVDGEAVASAPTEPTGLMRFPLQPGEHAIVAEWKRTPARYLGELLTLLSLLSCMLALCKWQRRATQEPFTGASETEGIPLPLLYP